ncbi:hypothetical protein BDV26DRAFT_103342 [Aspergillus bertholletiae]|uniref:Uncharacterized protein n=1 Tax=Aspergillus bertholletiae TaxID=1226010 RepID=A0A5N7ATD8_9EURO|nr:hypothetical protein BDV26DRAFT_103342 [Aspergillus bertholletiae]
MRNLIVPRQSNSVGSCTCPALCFLLLQPQRIMLAWRPYTAWFLYHCAYSLHGVQSILKVLTELMATIRFPPTLPAPRYCAQEQRSIAHAGHSEGLTDQDARPHWDESPPPGSSHAQRNPEDRLPVGPTSSSGLQAPAI